MARLDTETALNGLSGSGYYIGHGYDHMITDTFTVGVEANFHSFSDY